MRQGKRTLLVLALITAFAAVGLFLAGPISAGDLEPPAGPDEPASAMYTLEDIYHYLATGVKGTKREGGFVGPSSSPAPTGHSLDEVHAKIGERCITCEGTLSPEGRWCDNLNGTVTDMTTGLVWLKYADWSVQGINLAPERAGQCCDGDPEELTDGSWYGVWRLPTMSELVGITQGTEYVSYSTPRFFENVQNYGYWSSSVSPEGWFWVKMDDGSHHDMRPSGGLLWVWPVRSGNNLSWWQ